MKNILFVVKTFMVALMGGALVSVILPSASANASSQDCLNGNSSDARITMNGRQAVAHFKIPENCVNKKVTIASYKAPNGTDGKPYTQQKLYSSATYTYKKAGNYKLKVTVPDCYFQVDLARGGVIHKFSHGNTYAQEGRLLAAKHGGNKSCEKKATPAPTKPRPQKPKQPQKPVQPQNNVHCSNLVNGSSVSHSGAAACSTTTVVHEQAAPVVVERRVEQKVQSPAPVENKGTLPDTGPGDIAAAGFVWTVMGSMAYAYRGKMDSIVQAIVSKIG